MEKLNPMYSPSDTQKTLIPVFLAETVEYLHLSVNIYHCDIRVENIMSDAEGNLKLIDFDIAQTDVLAKPHTYVPEAVRCLEITPRLDLLDICLSMVLIYKLLCEKNAYSKASETILHSLEFYRHGNINPSPSSSALQKNTYFNNVQEDVYRIMRPQLECVVEQHMCL
jgi:serine/threonine protein kinase